VDFFTFLVPLETGKIPNLHLYTIVFAHDLIKLKPHKTTHFDVNSLERSGVALFKHCYWSVVTSAGRLFGGKTS